MRRSTILAALAAALLGCGDGIAEPEPPAPVPEEAPPRERERMAGTRVSPGAGRHGAAWRPSERQRDLARLLGDPATRERTLAELEKLPKGERIDVLRAGLRLEDAEAARHAASLLEWTWLDEWESALAVKLLSAWIYARPDEVDFDELRSYLGSSELGPVLAGAAGAPEVAANNNYIDQLHRQVRVEHVPILVDLAGSEHERFASDIRGTLSNILKYTDGPRERVGELVATIDERAADDGPLPRGAISPELARSLRAALFGTWEDSKAAANFRDWALRWFADVRPTAGDTEFLLDLYRRVWADGEEGGWSAQVGVLRALSYLDDAESLRALRDSVEKDVAVEPIVLALLARRGDEAAAQATWQQFEADALVMAFALESDPRRAGVALSRALVTPDSGRTIKTVETLTAADEARALFRLRWDPSAFAVVEEAARSAEASPLALGWIARRVPGCGTRGVVRAMLDGISAGEKSLTEFEPLSAEDRGSLLCLLEVAYPGPFRELLRRRAAGEDEQEAGVALSVLLRIGDDASGARLVDYVIDTDSTDEWREDDESVLVWLSRSRHAAVERYLREEIAAGGASAREAVSALASFHDLPERVAEGLVWSAYQDGPDGEIAGVVRDAILAGRPLDGLAALLAAKPDIDILGLGDVRDPRVAAHLEDLRTRREIEAYAWATGELAVMGDADARREVEAAVRAGRYRWVDNWRAEVLLTGVGGAEFWLDEAETNCCRLVVAGTVFADVFGQDYHDLLHFDSGRGETVADALRRWWADTGGKFAWSHLADRYVPLPR